MACSSCGRRSVPKVNNGINSTQVSKLLRYKSTQFTRKIYVGETKNYIGLETGIDYGIRNNGAIVLIHNDDLLKDIENFKDLENE